jgi:hypothetical protein
MLVDLMLPAGEKIVVVLEATGDDKIRVNSSSLDHPLTILADQSIEIVGIELGGIDEFELDRGLTDTVLQRRLPTCSAVKVSEIEAAAAELANIDFVGFPANAHRYF